MLREEERFIKNLSSKTGTGIGKSSRGSCLLGLSEELPLRTADQEILNLNSKGSFQAHLSNLQPSFQRDNTGLGKRRK
jgi:hypothetical protein